MGMFDNATDAHLRGEHDNGDTSGICPVCRRQSELAELTAVVLDDCPCCPPGFLSCPCHDTLPIEDDADA